MEKGSCIYIRSRCGNILNALADFASGGAYNRDWKVYCSAPDLSCFASGCIGDQRYANQKVVT